MAQFLLYLGAALVAVGLLLRALKFRDVGGAILEASGPTLLIGFLASKHQGIWHEVAPMATCITLLLFTAAGIVLGIKARRGEEKGGALLTFVRVATCILMLGILALTVTSCSQRPTEPTASMTINTSYGPIVVTSAQAISNGGNATVTMNGNTYTMNHLIASSDKGFKQSVELSNALGSSFAYSETMDWTDNGDQHYLVTGTGNNQELTVETWISTDGTTRSTMTRTINGERSTLNIDSSMKRQAVYAAVEFMRPLATGVLCTANRQAVSLTYSPGWIHSIELEGSVTRSQARAAVASCGAMAATLGTMAGYIHKIVPNPWAGGVEIAGKVLAGACALVCAYDLAEEISSNGGGRSGAN